MSNNTLYFKQFKIHEINIKNLVKIGMHINIANAYNKETSSYLIGKNQNYSILNLNSIIINLNLALNFLYCSLLQGSRLVLTEQRELKPKINTKKKVNTNKHFCQKSIIDKFKNFISNRLHQKKNNHISFKNYEIRGLFTNFKHLKNKKVFKKDTYGKNKKVTKGLRFLPDIILVNTISNQEWFYLLNELKNLKIPTILIKSLNYKWLNNFYYIPISKNNQKLQTFYWTMFIKIILKSLLMRKVKFEVKSLKSKINFKKEIFRDSINNNTNWKYAEKFKKNYSQFEINRKSKIILQTNKNFSLLKNNKLKFFRLITTRNLYNITTKYIKFLKKKRNIILNHKKGKTKKKSIKQNFWKSYKVKKNYKNKEIKNKKRFNKIQTYKIEKPEDKYTKRGKIKYGNTIKFNLFGNLNKLNKSRKMREFISKHLMANIFLGAPENKKVKQILNKYSKNTY